MEAIAEAIAEGNAHIIAAICIPGEDVDSMLTWNTYHLSSFLLNL